MLSPLTRQPHSPSSHADHLFLPMLPPDLPRLSSLTTHSTTPAPPPSHHPGPDPSSVDFRTFYPYTPNEVKHRKRTSRAQLKVLEAHFVRDTKPNATVRKVLADQLGMSVRGVQVWFQNRRAKAKSLAAKALAARAKSSPQLDSHSPSPSDPENPSHHGVRSHNDHSALPPAGLDRISGAPVDPSHSPRGSSTPSTGNTADFADTSSESSPTNTHPPSLLFGQPVPNGADSCPTPWQISPSADQTVFIVRPDGPDPFDPHNTGVRRGSLPVSYGPSGDLSLLVSDDMDAFPRRRSVDHSLLRLASNPYAPLALAKNGELWGTSGPCSPPPRSASSSFPSNNLSSHPTRPYSYSRPRITPSLSPVELSHMLGYPSSHHPPPTPASLHHHNHFSSRVVSAPLPGPLPSPNYSFGAAPVGTSPSPQLPSPVDSDHADSLAYVYHNQGHAHAPGQRQRQTRQRQPGDEADQEDDGSYRVYSRFGSMVSLAGSESSNNSAYFSEVSSGSSNIHTRSSPNGGFLNLMSGLNMNRSTASLPEAHTNVGPGSAGREPGLEHNGQDNHIDNGDGSSTSPYSSPSPTISPCQPLRDEPNPTISSSSALAFAFQHQRHHHSAAQMGDSTTINVNSNDGSQTQQSTVPFYYDSAAGDSGADSGSSLIGYNMSVLSAGHYQHQHHPGTAADMYAAYGTTVASVASATVNPSFLA